MQRKLLTMKTILIIEDDSYLSRTLTNILQFEGYNVCTAHNEEQAMFLIREFSPDLILSDIALGKDNGYSVLRKLKKTSYRKIPFIFISGKVKAKEILHGLQSGADDYITKPFDYLPFIQKVKKHIARVCMESRIDYGLTN